MKPSKSLARPRPSSLSRWRPAILPLALLLAPLAIGCGPAADDRPRGANAGGAGYRIAVVPKGTSHEFWKSVHAGAERAAREAGNVEILWKGPIKEDDREEQINIVEDFRVQHVDGICLAPLDSQGLTRPVKAARDDGIPTVIFDSGLDDADVIVSYVATDNQRSGELAADRLAEVLGGEGDVILMRYNPGSESTFQREEGFLKALKEKHPAMNVISSDQYAGITPEESLNNCQQILLKYRDDVRGVFTVCEPNSTGMLRALENAGLAGKVRFIAFDPNDRLIAALADHEVDGILLQDPIEMGYLAVKTMIDHLNGREVEKVISTGEFVATPDNMREPKYEALLHPVQFGE
jgi:ribose transport system substrate-binding protein